MVRLGIIGDTQGRYRVADLIAKIRPHFEDVDEIWHAGDWQYEEVLEELAKLRPLTVVNGNAPDDRRYPERVTRTIEGLDVGMVHRPPRADDEWANALDVCIHGHTHRWRDETVGRTRFINVSTPTLSGFFGSEHTAGLLTLDRGQARLEKISLG